MILAIGLAKSQRNYSLPFVNQNSAFWFIFFRGHVPCDFISAERSHDALAN